MGYNCSNLSSSVDKEVRLRPLALVYTIEKVSTPVGVVGFLLRLTHFFVEGTVRKGLSPQNIVATSAFRRLLPVTGIIFEKVEVSKKIICHTRVLEFQ